MRKSTRQRISLILKIAVLSIFVVLPLIVIVIKIKEKQSPDKSTKAAETSRSSMTNYLPRVRSTTYYDFPIEIGKNSQFVTDLNVDINAIQKNRFNTLWFVIVRDFFNPKDGVYNEQAYQDLKSVLALLKSRQMKAVLPLNYGNGPKYTACQILTDPAAYSDFKDYVTNMLTRLVNYADMTYIIIFTESVWNCNGKLNYYLPEVGEEISKQIRVTLGKLPKDLPADLRNKFSIGFYDAFIAQGWNKGTSSMYDATTYDFVGGSTYADSTYNNDKIKNEIEAMVSRIKGLYPNIPIFWGEVGATYCNGSTEALQASQVGYVLGDLINRNIGSNVWMWKPINSQASSSYQDDCKFGGHSITYANGSLKPAAITIRSFFKPTISQSAISQQSDGYAIWITGNHLYGKLKVDLFVNNQINTIPTSLTIGSDFSSFMIPSTILSTTCKNLTCVLEVQVSDENGNKSNRQKVLGTTSVSPTSLPSPTSGLRSYPLYSCSRCSTVNGCEYTKFKSPAQNCSTVESGSTVERTTDCSCPAITGSTNSRCSQCPTITPTIEATGIGP